MEPFDFFVGIGDVLEGFPCVMSVGISFPFDKILEFPSMGTRIQDCFDFEFFDIIHTVHTRIEARNGKHAGQKRTYRAVSQNGTNQCELRMQAFLCPNL